MGRRSSVFASREANIRSVVSASRLLRLWEGLRTSFWFLPAVMAGGSIVLSFVLVRLDTYLGVELHSRLGWFYTFGPEGARAILSAVASSMITVAGLTFSITMLTLQLASSQFGPRILPNFLQDRGNQIVLGTFISTFVYCLLVLRTVRGTEDASFVPHISVAFGVLFAIASLAVLIYFIHHVANAIRIEAVLATLASETRETIDRLYPAHLGPAPSGHRGSRAETAVEPPELHQERRSVRMRRSGYVQFIDHDALIELATQHDLVLRIEAPSGCFVTEDTTVLSAFPRSRVDDDIADDLRAVVLIGDERSPRQDLEFSIRRFVEIAQRALSPGTNDPTTALYCLDRLREAFCRLAERDRPSPNWYDGNGRLRIASESITLDRLACPALAAVARYGASDVDVVNHLLAVLSAIVARVGVGEASGLVALGESIRREGLEAISLTADRKMLEPEGEAR